MLMILVDHIELLIGERWISNYTMASWGPADALDLFVFISGYVFGLAYDKTLVQKGLWGCQLKAHKSDTSTVCCQQHHVLTGAVGNLAVSIAMVVVCFRHAAYRCCE